MKKIVVFLFFIFISMLFVGYYETRWIEDNKVEFFIKKSPTFQMSFVNVFMSDHEDNWHGELEGKERQYAIDFCRYFLDIETDMNTMDDFNKCKWAFSETLPKKSATHIHHENWDIPAEDQRTSSFAKP